MMSVLEYAEDVNKTLSEILNLCKRLGIPANNEEDMLDEDAIIELDNAIARDEEMEEYEEVLIKEEEKKETNSNQNKQKKQTNQQMVNKPKVNKKELAKKK